MKIFSTIFITKILLLCTVANAKSLPKKACDSGFKNVESKLIYERKKALQNIIKLASPENKKDIVKNKEKSKNNHQCQLLKMKLIYLQEQLHLCEQDKKCSKNLKKQSKIRYDINVTAKKIAFKCKEDI